MASGPVAFLPRGTRGSLAADAETTLDDKLAAVPSLAQSGPRVSMYGEPPQVAVGDTVELIALSFLRAGEDIDTEILRDLPLGMSVKILELGMNQKRAKVQAGDYVGWISTRTQAGRHLVAKPSQRQSLRSTLSQNGVPSLESVGLAGPDAGPVEASSVLFLRAGENVDSELFAELQPGTPITILETGMESKRRVKVTTPEGEGWITWLTKEGELLIARRAPWKERAKNDRVKALLVSARSGDVENLKAVVDSPGRPSVNVSDIRGKTALMYAATAGDATTVSYLLTLQGLSINAADDSGKTALHHAARGQPFQTGGNGSSADRGLVVVNMLEQHADTDVRDNNGCTPLMFACASGEEDVVQALLAAKAIVNGRDYEGATAFDYASNFGNENVMPLLQKYGGKPGGGGWAAGDDAEGHQRSMVLVQSGGHGRRGRRRSSNVAMAELRLDAQQADIMVNSADTSDRQRIMEAKLRAIMDNAATAGELEGALKMAEAAGTSSSLLEEGERRLHNLRSKAKALNNLHLAMAGGDPEELQRALDQAIEHRLPQEEIAKAQGQLAIEGPRVQARLLLAQAASAEDLREKLALAKEQQVPDEVLRPFEEKLAALEKAAKSKEEAVQALRSAMANKDLSAVQIAIEQARTAGVPAADIQKAEEFVQAEIPKQHARDELAKAASSGSVDELKRAVEKARVVALQPEEYEDAEALLKRKAEQVLRLDELKRLMAEAEGVDMESIQDLSEAKDAMQAAIVAAKQVGVLESELSVFENRRRRLHNTIEDLKGSIRVFCRIRPLSPKEDNDREAVHRIDDMTVKVEVNSSGSASSHSFNFDSIFAPGTQEAVFDDCKDLVQSACDGYNVTLFAYGQTGSGKTYTMGGEPSNPGVSRRTIEELYRVTAEQSDRYSYTVMGSMIELYRKDLRDLLQLAQKGKEAKSDQLKVRADRGGAVIIEGMQERECLSPDELCNLLDSGTSARKVMSTAMNTQSSRSHLIFIIKIVSLNKETSQKQIGKILIVDLAGSERLSRSEVTGDGAKEAIEINRSLTALGDVIEALTKGSKSIPYRNHTLTQVMQDALGGTAKTLMFINASPAGANAEETLQAMKWAVRAKNIRKPAHPRTKSTLTQETGGM